MPSGRSCSSLLECPAELQPSGAAGAAAAGGGGINFDFPFFFFLIQG